MIFNAAVEKLEPIAAPIVASMLGKQWLPVVLAIIEHESGGEPGIKANKETKFSRVLRTRTGGSITVKHAYGLMQTIPTVILDYENSRGTKIFFEDISGKGQAECETQIKIGCWLLRRFKQRIQQVVKVYKSDGTIDPDGLGFVCMAYAIGARPVIDALMILINDKIELTLENLEKRVPYLGKPANAPFKYARAILKKIGNILHDVVTVPTNWPLFIAVGLAVYLLFK
jgi:hypothetical protein